VKKQVDQVTILVDHDRRIAAQNLFADLGLDLATAINIFLAQTIHDQGFPFHSRLQAALAEVKNGDVVAFASEQAFYKFLDEPVDD